MAERYRPDLIVSQHGCDTHAWDPLADLRLSTMAFEHQARLLHRLAHERCHGRWLACGGGGYDVFRVVPRAWALLWGEMSGRSVPAAVPDAWRARYQAESPYPLPTAMRDIPDTFAPSEASQRAALANTQTLDELLRLLDLYPPDLARDAPEVAGEIVRHIG
jgi:acetoin utilization protein AcuC